MAYKRTEEYDEQTTSGLIKSYKEAIGLLGEDPEREGLLKTPERVAKAMQYLTQGYQPDAHAILNSAKFHEDVSEMIVVKDIELFSITLLFIAILMIITIVIIIIFTELLWLVRRKNRLNLLLR